MIQCVECSYEIIAEDFSSTHFLNITLNTAYTYRIRIDSTKSLLCEETLSLREHGQYTFEVQISSANSTIQCHLATQDAGNNIYIPLIIAAIILLALFVVCLVAQRLKWLERLVSLKNRCCKSRSVQEYTEAQDLQVRAPITNIAKINNTEETLIIPKSESVPKVSNVLVPRSKRLLSLDGFRGLSKIAGKEFSSNAFLLSMFSVSRHDICQLWWW